MKKIFVIIAIFLPTILFSQIVTNEIPYAFQNNIDLKIIQEYSIENFDCEKYIAQDKQNILMYPNRFAVNFAVNIDFNSLNYIQTENFKVAYLKIIATNAKAIGLIFKDFLLPKGAKMFVFDEQKKYLIGAITPKNNKSNGILPTRFISNDTIVVEFQLPNNSEFIPNFYISDIGVAYRSISNESDWCEIDINCSDDVRWQTLKKSVAKIVYQNDKDKSYYLCSGTMMANTEMNNTPYFLTANHCVNTESEANSAVFYFNYEASECGNEIFNENQTLSGASLVATADAKLDFSLLLLSEMPPFEYEPYFSGWSRVDEYSDTSTCIHHPAGDIKKISFDYDALAIGSFSGYDAHKHWKVEEWDEGTTEGGSSGSGIFTSDMLLIGTLSGGEASCDYNFNDYFQQFYHSWDDYNEPKQQLQFWLDPFDFNPFQMSGYDPYKNLDLAVPLNFKAEIDDSLVVITWEEPVNEPDSYVIYKNLEVFEETDNPETLFDILTDKGVYVYYATAIYSGEESKPSQMKSVVYGDTSSIPKVTEIRVYPNPTNEFLHIIAPDTIPITKIEVYNSLGQIVKVFEINEKIYTTINLYGLENSYYSLKISTIGETYIKKIIFIRNE